MSEVGGSTRTPPRPVLAAALATALQGLALFVVGLVLLVLRGAPEAWGFVTLLGAALAALGVALARGTRGARGPIVVLQILGLGVAYYTAVPGARPDWGVPVAVLCAAILAGVLHREGREWAAE